MPGLDYAPVLHCLPLLLLSWVIAVQSARSPPGVDLLVLGEADSVTQKVLTTDGKRCKLPFRFGGTIYHQCIPLISNKAWCSLTHNFDRDRQWGYCSPRIRLFNGLFAPRRDPGICRQNPCLNGGVCVAAVHLRSSECVCPDGFTGARCENKKCYEPLHLKYYDIGESWGRIHLRNVEQCTCLGDGVSCERARYTACSKNHCANEGVCRMIEATGEEVCWCSSEYTGQYCNINPAERCYRDSGEQYRGTASVTVSGGSCLPWNSDLLFNELTVETVDSAILRGLGDHSYCRNPDGDKLPWCYTMTNRTISWEYCDIPRCPQKFSRRGPVIPALPRPSRSPARTPQCGKRQEKRVSRARILGGTSSLPGAHPWMAALYIGDEFCAGTLVSSCWVVSAAHCFLRNPLLSRIRVVLGQHFFNDTGPNTRTFGVEKYISHPRYTQFQPTLNDIVLLKLKKTNGRCAQKTPFIRPICVPGKNMSFPDNSCCKISGWGHMHEKANSYSDLREGVVKIIPFERCSSSEVYGLEVRPGMVCAGRDSCVDACQGDSGGPLACECEGVNFLYGIISWGDGCGRTGKPGVYTLVPKYSDWINSIIKPPKKNTQNTSANRTETSNCVGIQCR